VAYGPLSQINNNNNKILKSCYSSYSSYFTVIILWLQATADDKDRKHYISYAGAEAERSYLMQGGVLSGSQCVWLHADKNDRQ